MNKLLAKVLTGLSATICGLALSGLFVTPVQAGSNGASGTITGIYVDDSSSAGGDGSTGDAIGNITWSYSGTSATYDNAGAGIYWFDANTAQFVIYADFNPAEDPVGASGSADYDFTYNGNSFSGNLPLDYKVYYGDNGNIIFYSLEGTTYIYGSIDDFINALLNEYEEESPMSQEIASEINDIKLASNGLNPDGTVSADKTITIEGKGALNSNVMRTLANSDGVTVNYIYEFAGYKFMSTITSAVAASVFTEDIPWYGPCFLANNFPTAMIGVVE